MYRIIVFSLVFWLVLLDTVENSKLTKQQILSRRRKQSPPNFLARQPHTCLISCFFELSFNDSLVLPSNCIEHVTNNSCDMSIFIDYAVKSIFFYSYQVSGSLTRDNITYESSVSHLAYLTAGNDPILHFLDYICATGDGCEWNYIKEVIPKLIVLDYQPLLDLLVPIISNSNGHPTLTECYNNTQLINCSSGSCRYSRIITNDNQLGITQECSLFDTSSIEIGLVRYFPEPAIHDYSTFDLTCDKDQCNDQSNVDEIMQIISVNANEYIYAHFSSGFKLRETNGIFLFFGLISIKYLFSPI